MFRMTTLKISLFSALATLMLLIAMLATSGTASAHTASSQATAFPQPRLFAYPVSPIGGDCEEIHLVGYGFAPGRVRVVDLQQGYSDPVAVFKTYGSFSRDVIICGDFGLDYGLGLGHDLRWGHGLDWGYDPVLIAIDRFGDQSNPATLLPIIEYTRR